METISNAATDRVKITTVNDRSNVFSEANILDFKLQRNEYYCMEKRNSKLKKNNTIQYTV